MGFERKEFGRRGMEQPKAADPETQAQLDDLRGQEKALEGIQGTDAWVSKDDSRKLEEIRENIRRLESGE